MHTHTAPAFHQWIKQRRQQLDLTQETLAERIGCAASTLRKIEAGSRQASRALLRRFASTLAVAPEHTEAFISWGRGNRLAPAALLGPAAGAAAAPAVSSALQPSLWPTIGREAELRQLCDLLSERRQRLITLTGPAGVGKTHLALAAAAAMQTAFRDGAIVVDATSIPSSQLLLPLIAGQLGITNPSAVLQDLVLHACAQRELLLVVDNMEHVLDASTLLATIVAAAPAVVVLATSQAALRVRGELRLRIKPLCLPHAQAQLSPDALAQFAATALFCERVRAVNAAWLDAAAPATITAICRRLDGLPLALELAAGYTSLFMPEELLAHLDAALPDLRQGHRDAPWRQQTLQRALEWSYNHLSATEQTALLRLAVLHAAWSREWGQQLLAQSMPEHAALELLSALEQKSLIEQRTDADVVRFRMLAVVREFALRKLAEQPWAHSAYADYSRCLLQLAKQIAPHEHTDWWGRRLKQEHATVRALIPLSIAANQIDQAAQMAQTLTAFWFRYGFWAEAITLLAPICAQSEQLALEQRIYLWRWLGHFHYSLDQLPAAEACVQRSLALALESNAEHSIGAAYNALALINHQRGDLKQAQHYLDQSERCAAASAPSLIFTNRGSFYESAGAYAQAQACYQRALELDRAQQNQWCISNNLANLASVALKQQQLQQAEALCRQAMTILEQLEHPAVQADVARMLGQLALKQHDLAGARPWLQQALNTSCALNSVWMIAAALELWATWFGHVEPATAAHILGHVRLLYAHTPGQRPPAAQQDELQLEHMLSDTLGKRAFHTALLVGQSMRLSDLLEQVATHAAAYPEAALRSMAVTLAPQSLAR